MTHDPDAATLAAYFDAGGTLLVHNRTQRKNERTVFRLRYYGDTAFITHLATLAGAGKTRVVGKQMEWYAYGSEAYHFLKRIRPHMRVRSDEVDEFLMKFEKCTVL